MLTTFESISGEASNDTGVRGVEKADTRRWVQIVLDDTNWIIYCGLSKKASAAGWAKMPSTGACSFWLEPGQELWIRCALASGGAGTVWNVGVTVCGDAA